MPVGAPSRKNDLLGWLKLDRASFGGFSPAKSSAPTDPELLSNVSPEAPEISAPTSTLSDSEIIGLVRRGDIDQFALLVQRYQPKLFATARRHARREEEVQDIVQEVFAKAFHRLNSFRGDAPFEHWLMRLAIHTCYDFLRSHQRNRELHVSDLGEEERNWLESAPHAPTADPDQSLAAKCLIDKILEQLSPAHRLIITLLEIEERSIKEIAELTGWSSPLVKVRAFRARAEMRKVLRRISPEKYL